MKGKTEIPRGIEVLVKKAAIDPEFNEVLLKERSGAAKEIELALEPSEVAMIDAVPERQLEAIIARTTVEPKQRQAFLGSVAAVMIVALGAATLPGGCGGGPKGIEPDRPDKRDFDRPEETEPSEGMRPDYPGREKSVGDKRL